MNNDDINLVEWVRVIKRRKVTILSVIGIGVGIFFLVHFDNVSIYQAVGHYKSRKVNFKFVEEAKIKYPQVEIEWVKNTNIMSIKTTSNESDKAKNKCRYIAKELRIKKVVNISEPKMIGEKKIKWVTILLAFTFFGILVGFIQDNWEKNKGKI